MTPKLYAGLRKANDKEKQSSGRDEDKTRIFAAATKLKSGRLTGISWRFGIKFAARWPRSEGARLIEGHLHANLFGGDMQLAAKGRGTLNRGGRNCRWDCTRNFTHFVTVLSLDFLQCSL